ncbi:plastocyanin/azurin family copper-binding protein [Halobellus sp. GM3]|uniref:plastocyanin/azurin family copper-binding protein n=1 Tax=Halobellus sp. GM3 TaxID=3458410 RepID=UPI00403D7A5C
MARTPNRLTRRSLLRTAAGASAAAAVSGTATAQAGQTHTVEMTDELVFDPDEIAVAPGDTIVWENVGAIGHSVTAYEDDIPEEADYFASGGFEAEQPARSAYSAGDPESGDVVGGASYEHTFEVEGTYEYFCIPHESAGMLGTVEVAAGGASDDGGGQVAPAVPDVAKTILVAATGALLAVGGLAYFFLKYGGDYELEGETK